MSTEKPTTPKDGRTAVPPTEYWREVQGHTGTEPEEEASAPSKVGPKATEEDKRGHVLSRNVRIVVPATLVVFAAALGWIVVPALVGGGSAPQSRIAPADSPAKAPQPHAGRPSRTRWVREPGEPNESARPPHRHAALGAPRERRHARPRHPSPELDAPSQVPASGATPPEGVPVPSEPAPPPSEPKEKPGVRDGATESTEFGL
jgi:hypothetical protein